jgi:16S rRNA (cytosine1402-N4)-methyltransferase
MESVYHTPVMLEECIGYVLTVPSGIYIDATCGGGGHAESIAGRLTSGGRLICIDRDPDAIRSARLRLKRWEERILFIEDVYSKIGEHLQERSIPGADGILFDLGVSSAQIDSAERGFSFQQDVPLDMRMDPRSGRTAAEIINTYSEKELADLFYRFGDERKSRQIARRLCERRIEKEFLTSDRLVAVIRSVTGERHLVKSLARIFQALRIEVNEELEHLERALESVVGILRPGGRLVIISYHSLEDRIVKQFLKRESATRIPNNDPLARADIERIPRLRIITKKPVTASQQEQRLNPRSRSAKLRAAERCRDL